MTRRRGRPRTPPRASRNRSSRRCWQAALFYLHTASGDLLAAAREIAGLQAARSPGPLPKGAAARRVAAFIELRRRVGRGIPALPCHEAGKRPDAAIVGGVVQAPNNSLADLLAGVRCVQRVLHLYQQAGTELGYEEGCLDTPMSPLPATAAPWRHRLHRNSMAAETGPMSNACWIVIAYLSGMRDAEKRAELRLMQHSAAATTS